MKDNNKREYIKPYKLSGKKCEKETDARDIVRLASSNIRNAGNGRNIITGGNRIEHPDDIIDYPDNISKQMIEVQKPFVDDETSKSRRIYSTTYRIPIAEYNLTIEDAIQMACKVSAMYSEYPCVYSVSLNEDIIRTDMIYSNYSVYGDRLTSRFKPAAMFNAYKLLRKDN